jgi:PhzF family phenazine biosynthesis protein
VPRLTNKTPVFPFFIKFNSFPVKITRILVHSFNNFNNIIEIKINDEMKIPLFQVDAFNTELFKGNPAAVCPLEKWLPDEILQKIANENNLSETAFFVKENGGFSLRWFTPLSEVDLCGHATLATAHVLFNHLNYPDQSITFSSLSGELLVSRQKDNLIYLDFPAHPPRSIQVEEAHATAFGAQPIAAFKAKKLMLVFNSEKEVLNLDPDFNLIKNLDPVGVIATSKGIKYDFVSRFFAPAVGINEDPVTGSAHTTLIPYWSEVTRKDRLMAWQCSKRGGILYCKNRQDRVLIGGHAVTYLHGTIYL